MNKPAQYVVGDGRDPVWRSVGEVITSKRVDALRILGYRELVLHYYVGKREKYREKPCMLKAGVKVRKIFAQFVDALFDLQKRRLRRL